VGEKDVEDNHFKMGVDDWDIIGQCTTSLMTVTAVVKQVEGDKYPTSILVLSFINSYMRSLSEDDPITVSNMYVKTSGRTWRIGGSQI
jgi:hypothetical protein